MVLCVLCGTAPLWRVLSGAGSAGMVLPGWSCLGTCWCRWAGPCGQHPTGIRRVSLDALWCRGCAWRGQMEMCVPWREVLTPEPLRPAWTPCVWQGALETSAGQHFRDLLLPLPGPAWPCVVPGRAWTCLGSPLGCAAQALPSPLLSASPGPRFCQPSTYQQEVKRLPESEVRTRGRRAPTPRVLYSPRL